LEVDITFGLEDLRQGDEQSSTHACGPIDCGTVTFTYCMLVYLIFPVLWEVALRVGKATCVEPTVCPSVLAYYV